MTVAHPYDSPTPHTPLSRLRTAARRLRDVSGHLRDVSARVHTERLDDLPFPAAVLTADGRVGEANPLFAELYPGAAPGVAVCDIVGQHDIAGLARALQRAASRRSAVTVLDRGVARVWTLTPAPGGTITVSV